MRLSVRLSHHLRSKDLESFNSENVSFMQSVIQGFWSPRKNMPFLPRGLAESTGHFPEECTFSSRLGGRKGNCLIEPRGNRLTRT